MFRQIAQALGGGLPQAANQLFGLHPSELVLLLENAWANRAINPNIGGPPLPQPPFDLGHPFNRSNVNQLPANLLTPLSASLPPAPIGFVIPVINGGSIRAVIWDHLIYAYMIENTRIYEIFRRVVHELLHGEKLGTPLDAATQNWLRTTEELFYWDPPHFSITAISSHIRSDMRASRRNAYQRMFGMPLNHGQDDGQPYPYVSAEATNNEFVSTFHELLSEVWVGITNVNNFSGVNPTDNAKIASLDEKLHDMLMTRRQQGNLSREEFLFVSILSWFHLTVQFNSPIVSTLRADAASPEQRLFKIAQRVGLPAHGLSTSYFDIADAISRVLILIETSVLNTAAAAPALYSPPGSPLESTMNTIITHWSIITGKDVKARKVAAT